jgi:hypothetical protein
MMTEDELNNLGETIVHSVPAGTSFILVMIPPHEPTDHPHGGCPAQTTSNIGCTEQMRGILEAAAAMFEHGTHEPMFKRPIEKLP